MNTFVIIPSGGSGSRTSHSTPKQYLKFGGKELIVYTLEKFQNCDLIDEIIVAAQPEYFSLLETIKTNYNFTKLSQIVEGGTERQYSVYNALKSIKAYEKDLIIVHDAARPLLPQKILEKAVKSAKIFDNVVVALRARDTLIKGDEQVESYIDRKDIYYAQTPQIFRYRTLMNAMTEAEKSNFIGTDESMLVNMASNKVKIEEGSSLNFKITNDDDIKLFEYIVSCNKD